MEWAIFWAKFSNYEVADDCARWAFDSGYQSVLREMADGTFVVRILHPTKDLVLIESAYGGGGKVAGRRIKRRAGVG